MISPQKAWLEPDIGVGGMSRTSCNTCEIADKLQKVHLGGHGEATRMTSRRARIKSRWSVRVRRRRVSCTLHPCLATCEAFCSRARTWLALPPQLRTVWIRACLGASWGSSLPSCNSLESELARFTASRPRTSQTSKPNLSLTIIRLYYDLLDL